MAFVTVSYTAASAGDSFPAISVSEQKPGEDVATCSQDSWEACSLVYRPKTFVDGEGSYGNAIVPGSLVALLYVPIKEKTFH